MRPHFGLPMRTVTVLIIPVVSAVVLIQSGHGPLWLANSFEHYVRHDSLLSSRDTLVLAAVAVLWTTLTLVTLKNLATMVAMLVRRAGVLTRRMSRSTSAPVRQFALLVLAAVASLSRMASSAGDMPRANPASGEESGASAATPTSRLPNTTGGSATLPALLSAGLAVGLTTRLQQDRALLLGNAPSGTTLRRPSGSALSRGTLLFQQARTEEGKRLAVPQGGILGRARPIETMEIPLGRADDHSVQLTIVPGAAVCIEAPSEEARAVIRYLVNTISLATWLQDRVVVTLGITQDDIVMMKNVIVTNSIDEAVAATRHARTEMPWSATILFATQHSCEFDDLLRSGAALVVAGKCPIPNSIRIVRREEAWMLSCPETTFTPFGMSGEDARDLRRSVLEMTQLESTPPAPTPSPVEWHILTRMLGPVDVETIEGREVRFTRSKSRELLCWLALHRDRPTVASARTALWEVDVEDATFHNVLSELRRGVGQAGFPGAVGRSSKHRLFISDQVVGDGELLHLAVRRLDEPTSSSTLCDARAVLELVRGLPFEASNYAWADAEGITSSLVWLIATAVDRVVDAACEVGDTATALAAVSAGLRASPGDERFLEIQASLTSRSVRVTTSD